MALPYKEAVLATAGLVSFWELGEAAGPALDLKGANPGTYEGSPSRAQASLLPGGEGKSVKLSPTTQFVSVANAASLSVGDVFSIEAIVRPRVIGAARGILSKGTGAYYMRVNAEGKLELLKSQTSSIATATAALSAETSYYVLTTKNGAAVKQYRAPLPGSFADVTGVVTNATCVNNALAVNIGGDTGFSTERWDGGQQYVALYNVALTEAIGKEHAALAQAVASSAAVRPIRRGRVVNP